MSQLLGRIHHVVSRELLSVAFTIGRRQVRNALAVISRSINVVLAILRVISSYLGSSLPLPPDRRKAMPSTLGRGRSVALRFVAIGLVLSLLSNAAPAAPLIIVSFAKEESTELTFW